MDKLALTVNRRPNMHKKEKDETPQVDTEEE
jgi:hypothetical protein